ncbi:MAG: sigma-70 family RNA polymerase sigma factor [Bacteroidetes bacterium]|nr:sigma-70 family RNA polymerase sigma factor [Bacteroidota bacterium]HOA37786.1 sigma-70 family RNA polymerase sigma factor [Flavihumibacter sp.]
MDEKEFLTELRAHQGIIYKVVSMYATNDEEKKDFYQEIVLQCWKGIGGFRGDAKFSTWLYRIAINTVLTLRRKKNILQFNELLPDAGFEPPAVFDQEDRWQLQAAIRLLSETDKAMALLFLDGYEISEMAAIMGISAAHTSVRMYRIKQRLAKIIHSKQHE